MLDLALSMYVLEVTGSAALFAAFLAAALVPTILWPLSVVCWQTGEIPKP